MVEEMSDILGIDQETAKKILEHNNYDLGVNTRKNDSNNEQNALNNANTYLNQQNNELPNEPKDPLEYYIGGSGNR